MPNDNKKMPMPMEQASYETSGTEYAPAMRRREEASGMGDKWRGGGDYYYEVTPQGIKVTGGDKAKTLTGGKSTMLAWADTDPKTMQMIQAILASRTEKGSELGATYSAPPPVATVTPMPEEMEASEILPTEGFEDRRPESRLVSTGESADPAFTDRMGESKDPTYDDKRMDVARRAMKKYGYSERD